MSITAQAADTITTQILLASTAAHDKAHATASATAKAHAKLDELRDEHGRWVHDNDALTAAATGRRASAIRVHDHVLYADTVPAASRMGLTYDLRPSEVISVRHHSEGSGKNRKRFTDIVTRHPDTGAETEESIKDGATVKLFPRENVRASVTKPAAAKPPLPPAPIPVKAVPVKTITAQAEATPPAPRPAPRPVPASPPPAPEPSPARPMPAGKELGGMDLWMSGEGVTPDVTPEEARAAKSVWFANTFSYTNDYLRNGTLPSVSSKNAISALHGGYGAGHLRLPAAAGNDADYLKGISTLKGMISRAPAFSRPAVMYRSVSAPGQVFGPVGSMKGRVFSDPGFMSATADPTSAERYGGDDETGGDRIVMHVPAGGGGMRAQYKFSPDNAREKEFTFAPGTQWRVDDDQMVNGKRQTTVTQIVPPGTRPGPRPAPVVPQIRTTGSWDAGGAGHQVNVETGEVLS